MKRHVMLVENHPKNRFIMAEQIPELEGDTTLVADRRAAIETIGRQPFAMILTDCHIPGMDGHETTRRIREREAQIKPPRVPVIAISAVTDTAHLKHSMDSVLKKPLRLDELRNMLGLWLDRLPSAEPAASLSAHAALTGQRYFTDIWHLIRQVRARIWINPKSEWRMKHVWPASGKWLITSVEKFG